MSFKNRVKILHLIVARLINKMDIFTESMESRASGYIQFFAIGFVLSIVPLALLYLLSDLELLKNNTLISAITVFILTFPLVSYNWYLKNKDTTQQLKNASKQQAEVMFSNALALLFREGDSTDSILARSSGLKELLRLKHDKAIEAKRIDLISYSGMNLSKAELFEADLREAKLQDTNLQEANLREAKLQKANLQDANLQEAKLQNANLQEAKLSHANLQKAKLYRANLQKAELQNANLIEAELQNANLQKADLQEVNLQEAKLYHANLQKAELYYANLQKAKLYRANLQKAELQNANLMEADFQKANLQNANLQNANLQNANLIEANLKEAKNMETANLENAIYNDKTIFPDRFNLDKAGMIN